MRHIRGVPAPTGVRGRNLSPSSPCHLEWDLFSLAASQAKDWKLRARRRKVPSNSPVFLRIARLPRKISVRVSVSAHTRRTMPVRCFREEVTSVVSWEREINEMDLPGLPRHAPENFGFAGTWSGSPQQIPIPLCECGAAQWAVDKPDGLHTVSARFTCDGYGRVLELRAAPVGNRGLVFQLGDWSQLRFRSVLPPIDNDML